MSLCDREGGRRESERERGRGNLDFVRFDAQETIKLHSRQEVLLIGEAGSRGYCPALRYDSTADATRVLKHKDQLALPHSPPLSLLLLLLPWLCLRFTAIGFGKTEAAAS